MNPLDLINKYYRPGTRSHYLITEHGKAVQKKALKIADRLADPNINREFLKQAAMLHDIGCFLVNSGDGTFNGDKPYLCHGYLGGQILEKLRLPKLALVCERHVGVGLTKEKIIEKKLPLPHRDMLPQAIEEEIIAYADKFYSKNEKWLTTPRTLDEIKLSLKKHGKKTVAKFDEWVKKFEPELYE